MSNWLRLRVVMVSAALVAALGAALCAAAQPAYLSPSVIVAGKDGKALYVACATGQSVLFVDPDSRKVGQTVKLPAMPTSMALLADGSRLFVGCAGQPGKVCAIDTKTAQSVATIETGYTANGVAVSRDGKTLYVCNRFDNDVSFISLPDGKTLKRVAVQREPVACALTDDGKHLLVANLLHNGAADARRVAAVVSVIDTAAGKVAKELQLPNGSGVLNAIVISPDGKHACVTHLIGRYQMPTTQIERGWINTNALSIVDLAKMEVVNSVLLDNVDRGAANPWGMAFAADGKTLAVALAGSHEISLIDFPALLAKFAAVSKAPADAGKVAAGAKPKEVAYISGARTAAEVPNDLTFLVDIRRRVALPAADRGPRDVAIVGNSAYAANYFSDSLSVVNLAEPQRRVETLPLGPTLPMTKTRQGEFYFNDASICFQGWQSCASCHPGDARVDALNWDLLNDGLGNPKNNRSLLYTHKIAPAMAMGARPTAEAAVRAGITHILFTVQPEEVPEAMDEYLKSLRPLPSPRLVKGQLSEAAQRGQKLFGDATVGCAKCHPAPLYTDMKRYDVGTLGSLDRPGEQYYSPTLVENWRTAPYLHDGSAATMRDVLTTRNPGDKHGKTSHLTPRQIDDLVEYLLSL